MYLTDNYFFSARQRSRRLILGQLEMVKKGWWVEGRDKGITNSLLLAGSVGQTSE